VTVSSGQKLKLKLKNERRNQMSEFIDQIVNEQTVDESPIFVMAPAKPKKARKYKIQINYPQDNSAFTVSSLIAMNGGQIQRVTVQQRINKEVAKGFLDKVGILELERRGRPEHLYKVNA
jgi:hypothetical protein